MRILITGASGCGTTTLGRALADKLRLPFFDVDDYYWLPIEKYSRIASMMGP
jgi:adenylate kinase family enzyme